jgi:hypothetical protein
MGGKVFCERFLALFLFILFWAHSWSLKGKSFVLSISQIGAAQVQKA